MSSKMIAVSLPEKLIKHLKAEAFINYETCSEYIKRSIISRMKADGVDISSEFTRSRAEADRQRLKDFFASFKDGDLEVDID